MDTNTCIRTRRSVRSFTEEPVSHALLEEIISVASYAPSWKNTQISRYIAIETRETMDYIADHFCMSFSHNANIIKGSPLLIAQTFVKNRSGFTREGTYDTDRGEGWQYYDCGIASQTFCLAAHEAGLGSVILGVFDRLALQEYLQIPPEQELMALIAVGHPAAESPAPKRKEVSDLLSYR